MASPDPFSDGMTADEIATKLRDEIPHDNPKLATLTEKEATGGAPSKQNRSKNKKKGVRFDASAVAAAAASASASASPATADRPRMSSARMSRYEFTNVISGRAEMLSRGAVPFIPLPPDFQIKTNMELREVALRELELGCIPFKIRREMPDGAIEEWKLGEMDIPTRYIETARMYDVKLE